MITIAGGIRNVVSGTLDPGAKLEVTLCGFGALLPRVSGTALLAPVKPAIVNCPAGTYSFTVYGNDTITPAGTFYTVRVVDDLGATVQIGAYQFVGAGPYDLASTAPYNPPAAPSSFSYLVVVSFSATPVFLGGPLTTFEITLTADVTSSTIPGTVRGALYTFVVVQNGAGGHTFVWPAVCIDAPVVSAAANAITLQTFVCRSDGQLYPIAPGIYV